MADGRYAIGVPTMSFTNYTQGFVPNKNAVFVSGPDGSLSEARLYNNGGSHYTKIQDRPNGFLLSNFSTKYGGPSFFKPLIITTDSDLNSGCNEIDVTQQVGLVNEAWEFVDITFSVDTGYTIQPYSTSSDYAYQLVGFFVKLLRMCREPGRSRTPFVRVKILLHQRMVCRSSSPRIGKWGMERFIRTWQKSVMPMLKLEPTQSN
ncbi:MAG: hypothetical protein IPJ06_10240 [Saprospiraceae bacterium]|nr:hypothetical protein [Saprospiraceae bacterium]